MGVGAGGDEDGMEGGQMLGCLVDGALVFYTYSDILRFDKKLVEMWSHDVDVKAVVSKSFPETMMHQMGLVPAGLAGRMPSPVELQEAAG